MPRDLMRLTLLREGSDEEGTSGDEKSCCQDCRRYSVRHPSHPEAGVYFVWVGTKVCPAITRKHDTSKPIWRSNS